jgi:hypothetical protein
MALKGLRRTQFQSLNHVTPFAIERGGILSLSTLSGVKYAVYEFNPTAFTVPLGMMQFDTEEVDLYRAIPPWRSRSAYPPFTPLPYITQGTVITNAIDSKVTSIIMNTPAYLAPSGLITNSIEYNTRQIGRFASILNAPELGVITLPTQIRVAGDGAIVLENNVYARTAGWCKIHLDIK